MGEIKSALDKALERAEKIKLSPEELAKLKYSPEGEKLAAKYLKGECDISAELDSWGEEVREHLIKGAREVFLRNIDLPRQEQAKASSEKAMEGIKLLTRDRARLEGAYDKIRRIFSHYEQEGEVQRRQAYQLLKEDLQNKLQQALQVQLGSNAPTKMNVEALPEFQQEWHRVLAQLDSQYYSLLGEYKQEIESIS